MPNRGKQNYKFLIYTMLKVAVAGLFKNADFIVSDVKYSFAR